MVSVVPVCRLNFNRFTITEFARPANLIRGNLSLTIRVSSLRRRGQAQFAPKTPQNEPVPGNFGKSCLTRENKYNTPAGVQKVSEADCQPMRCVTMNMNVKILACLSFAVLFCALVGDRAQAQSGYAASALQRIQSQNNVNRYSVDRIRGRISGRSVSVSGVPGVNRRSYGGVSSSSRRPKPFSSINRGPAVSPYLALSGSLNSVSDYYNIVRPQFEQARSNARLQRQTLSNQRRLNKIASRGPYNLQGDGNLAPTGHSATYMFFDNFQSTGNFFPPTQGLEKRQ